MFQVKPIWGGGVKPEPQVGRESWPLQGGGAPRARFIPLPLPVHNPI